MVQGLLQHDPAPALRRLDDSYIDTSLVAMGRRRWRRLTPLTR
jgi:hypothetical protein